MSKILDELKKQEEIEGLTDDLKLVHKIYQAIMATSRSGNAFNILIGVKYHGKTLDALRFRYTTPLVRELMKLERAMNDK